MSSDLFCFWCFFFLFCFHNHGSLMNIFAWHWKKKIFILITMYKKICLYYQVRLNETTKDFILLGKVKHFQKWRNYFLDNTIFIAFCLFYLTLWTLIPELKEKKKKFKKKIFQNWNDKRLKSQDDKLHIFKQSKKHLIRLSWNIYE